MTILAYASADAAPATNPHVDAVHDLSGGGGPLPIANTQLYGAGTDDADPGAVWTYSWSVLKVPTGSAAALDNGVIQAINTAGSLMTDGIQRGASFVGNPLVLKITPDAVDVATHYRVTVKQNLS